MLYTDLDNLTTAQTVDLELKLLDAGYKYVNLPYGVVEKVTCIMYNSYSMFTFYYYGNMRHNPNRVQVISSKLELAV